MHVSHAKAGTWKMKSGRVFVIFFVGVLWAAFPIFAHHGFSAYDQTKPLTVSGTVTQFEFVNPHIQVYFDAKNEKGETQHWGIELATPALLARRGWNSKIMKPGDEITATCYRAKNGSNTMARCTKIFRGGEELSLTEGN
jgi:Family of unknown function (DUF6152)